MSIEKFSYLDAQYSYLKTATPSKGRVISYGEVVEKNNNFIHIKVGWSEKTNKIYFGLVIPAGCFGDKEKKINFKKGETIGIYWNDIFLYDEDYTGIINISSMYTEGNFIDSKDGHILISNPETINLKISKNHPEKKPVTYSIPHGMITSIKKYERKS